MQKPVIGITSGGRSEKYVKSLYYDGYFSVPAPYIDAVLRAGGIPLIVPAAVSDWESILPLLDGVIVTGGTDIDPIEYGGNRAHPELRPIDRERDHSELTLVRRLLDEGKLPLLGVCRGLQTVNVATGGTLHEHIPDIIDQNIHRSSSNFWAMQDLRIEPDSLLAKVVGTTALRTASGHHQAVKEVGTGLRVVCRATDGIIEALEMPGYAWLLAVQWHPEVTADHDQTQQALFDALVARAAAGQSPA
ncbi:MAG: gamma-glutamyl-gamma-aminobutyrate hydrolase family protein [Chloroflexota bacterium]|nr:gamma-glutamyl-gamma-aminobutyrate hydrolase family protein [Chloroflexota bacterium]MCY3582368.1 gamma-glutamyl-gamma-aminobutyrate hydrolase family protein [Chloroflexota bacterium]MDE2650782.1 gamma-glutamyl-gamma-aminobutyrate hydrolase family protein [Chloroflexota bacterium]MXV93658.1 gamma-glutamyl-gamma-aminobutyrate hydrolase family protein [Chloroflexota bacterium]MXX50750.1 gamma-glutamyl-gamma-aminobutyrate hydrolase family protein [Chloroflexota bacterium]